MTYDVAFDETRFLNIIELETIITSDSLEDLYPDFSFYNDSINDLDFDEVIEFA